jgi:hypothetical protein
MGRVAGWYIFMPKHYFGIYIEEGLWMENFGNLICM